MLPSSRGVINNAMYKSEAWMTETWMPNHTWEYVGFEKRGTESMNGSFRRTGLGVAFVDSALVACNGLDVCFHPDTYL